ncbi:MAG: DUF4349 domain-containing protein [Clostridia bacterium]|nr:DUF4349 domain-containing protein [Clostridia bacterium]
MNQNIIEKHIRRNIPFTMIAVMLILSLFLTSCGSSKPAEDSGYGRSNNVPMASESAAPAPGDPQVQVQFSEAKASPGENGLSDVDKSKTASTAAPAQQDLTLNRKIIKEGNASVETKEFDKTIEALDQLIDSVGGFSEVRTVKGKNSQNSSPRYANYVFRVPAGVFENVMNDLGSVGTVIESNSKGTDITDQYMDAQTRINTLKVQEQTLIEIMAKATKLEDVITLESRISEVRYEIESLENTLKNYDRLVAFSRITVNIQEVTVKTETKPKPETLGQRISTTFNDSLESLKDGFEDLVVWIVGSWLTLIVLLVGGLVLLISYRRAKKKKAKSQQGEVQLPTLDDKSDGPIL